MKRLDQAGIIIIKTKGVLLRALFDFIYLSKFPSSSIHTHANNIWKHGKTHTWEKEGEGGHAGVFKQLELRTVNQEFQITSHLTWGCSMLLL